MSGRAVFLDRDGVLNRATVRDGKPFPPQTLEEFEVLPGVGSALDRLKSAGFALVVVTNQPDVARGRQRREVIEEMHALLRATLPLDEIRVCYHDDIDHCGCRKPQPGMLLAPPSYDVARSYIIGDSWRDIEAGLRAGCRGTVLVDYSYDERVPREPDARVGSLVEAAEWILERMSHA